MQSRLDAQKVAPAAYHAMLALETSVRRSSHLEPALVSLVRLRASQINGCAILHRHAYQDARAQTGRPNSALHPQRLARDAFFTVASGAALA